MAINASIQTTGGERLKRVIAEQRRKLATMPKGVRVGSFGKSAIDAAINEFGLPHANIPERPAFRLAIQIALPKMRKRMIELARQDGVITRRGAREVAMILRNEIETQIKQLRVPPNRPWKGPGANPLIFTGALIKSLGFEIID